MNVFSKRFGTFSKRLCLTFIAGSVVFGLTLTGCGGGSGSGGGTVTSADPVPISDPDPDPYPDPDPVPDPDPYPDPDPVPDPDPDPYPDPDPDPYETEEETEIETEEETWVETEGETEEETEEETERETEEETERETEEETGNTESESESEDFEKYIGTTSDTVIGDIDSIPYVPIYDDNDGAFNYKLVVNNVPSDMDNVLVFDEINGDRYKVTGKYNSEKNNMEYDFSSPADEVRVVYISIGPKKSTVPLNKITSKRGLYTCIARGQRNLNYNTDMGKNGNAWTYVGCTFCDDPGDGAKVTYNLIYGDGKCNVCHGSGKSKTVYDYTKNKYVVGVCTKCLGDTLCQYCMGVGAFPQVYAKP